LPTARKFGRNHTPLLNQPCQLQRPLPMKTGLLAMAMLPLPEPLEGTNQRPARLRCGGKTRTPSLRNGLAATERPPVLAGAARRGTALEKRLKPAPLTTV